MMALQRKFPPPTTQRRGGQECCTRSRSPNENTLWRPYVPANFHRGKQDLHILVLPLLAPSAGCPWNDLHLITCGASVGSCCCLLILSFTYNRRVLFTNRIQNSRCFIMSLLCVITNAAGRLLWLPLCRLLPGLRRAALPCHRGHALAEQQQKQKNLLLTLLVDFFIET